MVRRNAGRRRRRHFERQFEGVVGFEGLRRRSARVDAAVFLRIAVERGEHRRDGDSPVVALGLEQLPVGDADRGGSPGLRLPRLAVYRPSRWARPGPRCPRRRRLRHRSRSASCLALTTPVSVRSPSVNCRPSNTARGGTGNV